MKRIVQSTLSVVQVRHRGASEMERPKFFANYLVESTINLQECKFYAVLFG